MANLALVAFRSKVT